MGRGLGDNPAQSVGIMAGRDKKVSFSSGYVRPNCGPTPSRAGMGLWYVADMERGRC